MFTKEDYRKFTRKDLDTLAEKVKGYPYSSYFDVQEFRREVQNDQELPLVDRLEIGYKTPEELSVIMARARLTQKGFEQLLRKI